ncbi:two-component system, OmpR family, sensor histidine kinase QseC [Lampropedia hyalina DSM 16112]|jgi:two-component system sensor histidine kinase QseC|uniref:histidine kinase n=1 Tax=Lampropedia hyalina DSM 16112 TaxID=1122156 RepID=A0A1M4S838_9BURK|nr:ATP-binding protein [Lampropedia hyalina]SHE28361.1 two-component system, OmpR family, sensor histidine kinase QseC [Lampropedia hyalina DSM 16112]
MTTSRTWSLRQRLLWMVMGISMGLWLVSLAIVIGVAWFATSEVFDEALEEGARLVLQLGTGSENPSLRNGHLADGRGDTLKLRMYYQLVGPDGRVLLRGEDTPEEAFLPHFPHRKGFATVHRDGEFWRVHVRQRQDGIAAQVAQPLEERLDLLEDMAENLAWPALLLLALLGLASWFTIRHLLRPLEELATRIASKSPTDLSPVSTPHPPRELQPMLAALNSLLARLETTLDNERRFTADAAHELRTPLSALRMRTQLIERELGLPVPQLRQLRADVDRCTALVESLLALARLDAQPLERETVALSALVASLDLAAVQARGMVLECALAASHLQASPTLLASALRNLVDNAVRYGREQGRIRIESQPLPAGGVRLAVRDDGPGVAASARAQLGQRFFRILGTGQSGNGLGLSIVARIATLHAATLHFEDGLEGRGLGVVLDFPGEVPPDTASD